VSVSRKTQIMQNYAKSSVSILEKELSYKVVGCFFNVVKKYGKGFKENLYQKALAEEFEKQGLKFKEQQRIDIFSLETGKKLSTYIPDFVIEDKIIVEIKSMSFTLKSSREQQLSYLKCSRYEIAYLVNFGTPRLDVRRLVYSNNRKSWLSA
jgi:GxxExxY protein